MRKSILFVILLCVWVLGCDSSSECIPAPTFPQQRQQAALHEMAFLGDKPSFEGYEEIERIKESGRAFRFGVYGLGHSWSAKILSSYEDVRTDERDMMSRHGDWDYILDRFSMYEEGYDHSRFMVSNGVEEASVKENSFYLQRATRILEDQLKYESSKRMTLYPYDIRVFVKEIEYAPGKVEERIDHVGIAFASRIDGWPVVGPGGMVYVFMSPEGDFIGYQIYRKRQLKLLGMLEEKDILSPDEAVKNLYSRGDLEGFAIDRYEFGYYYDSKHSVREIIAPSYVFYLKAKDPEAQGRVEVINAVRGGSKLSDLIVSDIQSEEKRLLSLLEESGLDSLGKEVQKP